MATTYVPLKKCPAPPEGLEFATYWHRLAGIEDYWICTKCYQENFKGTIFETVCETFYHEELPGHSANCDFHNALQARRLVQGALRSGLVDDMLAFARKRMETGMCAGLAGVRGGTGVKWYSNPEIPSFVVCESCYLDYLPPPLFSASRLHPHPTEQEPDGTWVCDIAVPYINRLAQKFADDGDWPTFRDATNHRMSLPSCTPQAVKRGSRKWLRPTSPWSIQEVMFCEACSLDFAGCTNAFEKFVQIPLGPGEQDQEWICDFQIPSVAFGTKEIMCKDYNRWHRMVADTASRSLCSQGDITDGEWYTLRDPSTGAEIPNTDFCAACFAGYFSTTEYTYILSRKSYPPGTIRVCDFSPASARAPVYMAKYKQMLISGDHRPLVTYASRVSQLPTCSRSQSVQNQSWWGHDDFFFCTSCYHEFGQDTYFASSFPIQNRIYENATCDMYTPNMRRQYILACRSQSLTDFLSYCKERASRKEMCDNAVAQRLSLTAATNRVHRNHVKFASQAQGMAYSHGAISAGIHGQSYTPNLDLGYMRATQNLILAQGMPRFRPVVSAQEREMRRRWEEVE